MKILSRAVLKLDIVYSLLVMMGDVPPVSPVALQHCGYNFAPPSLLLTTHITEEEAFSCQPSKQFRI